MKKQIQKIFRKEEELQDKIDELETIMNSSATQSEKVNSVKSLLLDMRKEVVKSHYDAITDDLTGLLNKKVLHEVFQKKVAEAKRNKEYLSLILIDIDNMKLYNDTYGHLAGTKLIKDFAKAINKSIRGQDIASRYGGDEFLALCVHKEKSSTDVIADRIMQNVAKIKTPEIPASASYGYAIYSRNHKKFDDLFAVADKNLYAEKREKKLTKKEI